MSFEFWLLCAACLLLTSSLDVFKMFSLPMTQYFLFLRNYFLNPTNLLPSSIIYPSISIDNSSYYSFSLLHSYYTISESLIIIIIMNKSISPIGVSMFEVFNLVSEFSYLLMNVLTHLWNFHLNFFSEFTPWPEYCLVLRNLHFTFIFLLHILHDFVHNNSSTINEFVIKALIHRKVS